MVYLIAILSCFYALFEGVREAFYYNESVKNEKQENIHWIFFIQRGLFAVILLCASNYFILCFFLLTFSFLHDGAYYFTRNKLNPAIYKNGFFDDSKTSTAVLELSLLQRSLLALGGILFIVLNIVYV